MTRASDVRRELADLVDLLDTYSYPDDGSPRSRMLEREVEALEARIARTQEYLAFKEREEEDRRLGLQVASGSPTTYGAPGRSCTQCGAGMNPAEWILGPVCGRCCRANHRAATGRR